MQHSPNKPRSWAEDRRRKKSNMASSTMNTSKTDMEDENLLSPGFQDTLQRPEWEEEAGEEHYREYNDNDGPADKQCTELLDELELRKLSVLRRMAKKDANRTQLRAKVWNLEASPHRQSKLKTLRRNMNRNKGKDSSIDGAGRLWVEVDDGGCPTGAHRPDWLTKLQGYSRDLDWSVDNFKAHPRALLMAIKDKISA